MTAISSDAERFYEAVTDEQGEYVLENLPERPYQVRVEYPEHRQHREGVHIEPWGVTIVNVRLKVGSIANTGPKRGSVRGFR